MDKNSIKKLINQYFDGELNVENEALVLDAVNKDKDLKRYFNDIKSVKKKVGKLRSESAFRVFKSLWRNKVKTEHEKKILRRRTIRSISAVAAAAVIVIFGFRLFNSRTIVMKDEASNEAFEMEMRAEEAPEEETAIVMEAAEEPEMAMAEEEDLEKSATKAYTYILDTALYEEFVENLRTIGEVSEQELEIFDKSVTIQANTQNVEDINRLLGEYDLIESDTIFEDDFVTILFE